MENTELYRVTWSETYIILILSAHINIYTLCFSTAADYLFDGSLLLVNVYVFSKLNGTSYENMKSITCIQSLTLIPRIMSAIDYMFME